MSLVFSVSEPVPAAAKTNFNQQPEVWPQPAPIRHDELWRAFERWPLVMAYGLDEYGSGFFTLTKSVTGILPAVEHLSAAGL